MTKTDTMDIRSIFTKTNKTETMTVRQKEAWETLRTMTPEQFDIVQDEAYREGFKDALEDYDRVIELLTPSFEFDPTLHDIANGGPTLSLADKDGNLLYRHPTKAELDKEIWKGALFRFPIGYDQGERRYATYRAVLTGETWTLGEFLERARLVYTAQNRKHLKAMGDHIFFEGFVGDTFYCGS